MMSSNESPPDGQPTEKKPWTDYQRPEHEEKLFHLLEEEAQFEDMNIEHLVNEYRKYFPGQAVWRLINDMQKQALIWSNVIELLKNNPCDMNKLGKLKYWYESELHILPADSLSNPWWQWDMDTAFQRLRSYSKGLIKAVRSFAQELMIELNVEVTSGTTVEVQLGFPPALTIGFHKGISFGAGLSAAVPRV